VTPRAKDERCAEQSSMKIDSADDLKRLKYSFSRKISSAIRTKETPQSNKILQEAINGEAACLVNSALGRHRRRSTGIFFSGKIWADLLAGYAMDQGFKRIVDPACGTGDLLLAVGERIASRRGRRPFEVPELRGYELESDLAAIARTRLKALTSIQESDRWTASIVVQNSLSSNWKLKEGDLVLMNPPYHRQIAHSTSAIGTGLVSSAALFVESALEQIPIGGGIIALVPDVLRSGSNYRKLREILAESTQILLFDPVGRFSADADVDVSVLWIKKGGKANKRTVPIASKEVISSYFDVSVGSVVPHRTKMGGMARPYAHPGSVVSGTVVDQPTEIASYCANTVSGPLVLIRRTSSPKDRVRARGCVIASTAQILIENHLIVCKPKSGLLSDCARLMDVFNDAETSQWLNNEIRCRHLTVGVVRAIPYRI